MAVLPGAGDEQARETRWGRAAGLRAPRLGARAGRGQLLLRVFSQDLGVAASLSTSTRRHLDLHAWRRAAGPRLYGSSAWVFNTVWSHLRRMSTERDAEAYMQYIGGA